MKIHCYMTSTLTVTMFVFLQKLDDLSHYQDFNCSVSHSSYKLCMRCFREVHFSFLLASYFSNRSFLAIFCFNKWFCQTRHWLGNWRWKEGEVIFLFLFLSEKTAAERSCEPLQATGLQPPCGTNVSSLGSSEPTRRHQYCSNSGGKSSGPSLQQLSIKCTFLASSPEW